MASAPSSQADNETQWLRLILISLNEIENQFLRLEDDNEREQSHDCYTFTPTHTTEPPTGTPQPGPSVEYSDGYRITHEDDSDSSDDSVSTETSSQTSLPPNQSHSSSRHNVGNLTEDSLDQDLIFRESATQEDINIIEKILDIKLPRDYVHFLLLTNGLKRFPSRSDPGLRIIHDTSLTTPHNPWNSRLTDPPGLHWQKLPMLDPSCPALKWFPEPQTMIKISNHDHESHVWLIKPAGMRYARLHGYLKSRRDSFISMPQRDSSTAIDLSSDSDGWGVLRWTKPPKQTQSSTSLNLDKPLPPPPSSVSSDEVPPDQRKEPPTIDASVMFLYCSFSDYLAALLDSLETAFHLELDNRSI